MRFAAPHGNLSAAGVLPGCRWASDASAPACYSRNGSIVIVNSAPTPPTYRCHFLARDLKAVRTIILDCQTVDDAIEKVLEMLRGWKDEMPLAGFGLLEGNMRILYRLASSKTAHGLSLTEKVKRAPEME